MKAGMIHMFRKEEDAPTYTRLAPLYDRIMDHVDYAAWADYIALLFERYGADIRFVVEGGCGTASLMRILHNYEYIVAGFDRAVEMIRVARRKTSAPLWQGDLKNIGIRRKCDAFLCLYDTMQYLKAEDMETVFSEVMFLLKDLGLFVFDLVPEGHILRHWIHYTERDQWNGWESIRRTWYDKKRRTQHTEFFIESRDKKKRYREHHKQRIYHLDEIITLVKNTGFRLLGCFDEFTLNPGSENSDRVHFVLRKETS